MQALPVVLLLKPDCLLAPASVVGKSRLLSCSVHMSLCHTFTLCGVTLEDTVHTNAMPALPCRD